MTIPTIDLTEAAAFAALRSFLLATVPSGIEVIRAEDNRVPEPAGLNFVVMTQLRQTRLSTNLVDFFDNIVTASIVGSVLTVTKVTRGSLEPGLTLIDGTAGRVALGTTVGAQLAGAVGGTGTYAVSPAQSLASGTLWAGQRTDLAPIEWTVQLDFHGPTSADAARIFETLFWSDYGVAALEPTVTPLYCDPPGQRPFFNAEQEIEYRWSIDAVMQINPIIGTPQEFADQLKVTTIEVDVMGLPGSFDFSDPSNSDLIPSLGD